MLRLLKDSAFRVRGACLWCCRQGSKRPPPPLTLPLLSSPPPHPTPTRATQLRFCYRSNSKCRHELDSLLLVEELAAAGYRPTVFPRAVVHR